MMLRGWIDSGVGGIELAVDLRACAAEMERDKAEIKRLRLALTEIAIGRDAKGLKTDFPSERAQEALNG